MGYFVLGVSSPPSLSSILLTADRAAQVPGKNPTGLHLHSGMGDDEGACLVLGTRVPKTKRETRMEAGRQQDALGLFFLDELSAIFLTSSVALDTDLH